MIGNLTATNDENNKSDLSIMERLYLISEYVSDEEYRFIFENDIQNLQNIQEKLYYPPQPIEQEKEVQKQKNITKNLDSQIDEEYGNSILNDHTILKWLQLSENCVYDQEGLDFSDDNEIEPDQEEIGLSQVVKRDNPARILRKKKDVNYLEQYKMIQPHSYVKYRYLKKQPFVFYIDMDALLILTLHSHLSKHEVIGLMGGKYNKKKREIRIHRIVPCKNIPTKDDFHNVEMDPLSNLQAQHELDDLGLINMGWYHSHPIFKTTPSYIDQKSHEILSKQYADNIYFGLIISPFKVPNKDSICDTFLFFCIQKEVCRIEYQLQPVTHISNRSIDHLVDIYRTHLSVHNSLQINSRWKGKCSFLEKLSASLDAIVIKNNELLDKIIPTQGSQQIPMSLTGVQTILKKFQFCE